MAVSDMDFWFFVGFGVLLLSSQIQGLLWPCMFWDDAVYIQGKCFKVFTDQWLDWDSAQEACAFHSSSGRLAEPATFRQLNAITRHLEQRIPNFKGFVGGRYDESINGYTWAHEGNLIINSPAGTIPSDGSQSCVTYNDQGFDLLHVDSCSTIYPFICEQAVTDPCHLHLQGSEYYNGSCFLIQNTYLKNEEAQEHCRNIGAYLAEPVTMEMVGYLKDLLISESHTSPMWIGVKSIERQGVYGPSWITSGQMVDPQLYDGPIYSSECLLLIDTPQFHKEFCGATKPFLCQKDVGNPCEEFYSDSVFYSGYCYQYVNTPANYTEAEAKCKEKNGHIVEMQDQETKDFVIGFMMYKMKEHEALGVRGSAPIWVGLTHLDLDSSTRWRTDGNPLGNRYEWPAWHDHFGMEDYCAVMTSYGMWEQKSCGSQHGYMCQSVIPDIVRKQRYHFILGLWHEHVTSSQLYITVTSPSTTPVPIVLSVRTEATGMVDKENAVVSDGVGYYKSLLEYVGVGLVKSTRPVTVTLMSKIGEDVTSTLVYPTVRDQLVWVFDVSYFVINTPIISDRATTVLFMGVALEDAYTRVHFQIEERWIWTDVFGQYEYFIKTGDTIGDNWQGYSILSDYEIVVFVMQITLGNDIEGRNMTMMFQMPLLNTFSTEYVSLPTYAVAEIPHASLKVTSKEQGTNVTIGFSAGGRLPYLDSEIVGELYDEYQLVPHSTLDIAVVTFNKYGVFSSQFSSSFHFVLQSGSNSFHMLQTFGTTLQDDIHGSFCAISNVPQVYWRQRYDAMLFPVSASIMNIAYAKVYLYLVVEKTYTHDIFVNGKLESFNCNDVEESFSLSGCVGRVESLDYNQILTVEMAAPFAAYVFVSYKNESLSCHPMGLQLPHEDSYTEPIDLNNGSVSHLPSLPPPPTTTTTTTIPTTTTTTTTTTTSTTTTTTTTKSPPPPQPTTTTRTLIMPPTTLPTTTPPRITSPPTIMIPTTKTTTRTTTTPNSASITGESTTEIRGVSSHNADTTENPCPTMYTHKFPDPSSASTTPTTNPTTTATTSTTTTPTTTTTSTTTTTPTLTSPHDIITPIPSPSDMETTMNASLVYECRDGVYVNLTAEEEAELLRKIQTKLYVPKINTTISKRRKGSADDNRLSSRIIGGTGVFLFFMEVAVIVVPDVLNVYRFIFRN